jgi:anti-sigma-K factor RskA
MQTDDDLRETLRRTAAELEQWSSETRARFDELKTRWEEQQRQFRFFSRNRDNFWRMPKWLWVPVVASLVGLFVLALYSVGYRSP